MEDATCYKTYMRYPTDVKLLWECVEWSHSQLKLISKYLKIRMPRNKYEDQWNKYNNSAISEGKHIKKLLREPGACFIPFGQAAKAVNGCGRVQIKYA